MYSAPRYDLSVVVTFGDDEEVVGPAMRILANHLRNSKVSFEIIAVDEDCADNSHAILALVRPEIGELRVLHAPPRSRAVEVGIDRAQGHLVAVLAPAEISTVVIDRLLASCREIADSIDVDLELGRFLVAHRVRVLDAFSGARLQGQAAQRRFAKRLAARGLRVRLGGMMVPRPPTGMARIRAAFVARRAS